MFRLLRPSLWLLLPAVLFISACDGATTVEDTSTQGGWYGVGALQGSFPELRMDLTENAAGEVQGAWRRGGQGGAVTGTHRNGQITLTLSNFEVGTVVFQGRLTTRYRLAGTLQGFNLPGEAVFVRTRF
jgi:hypothetical protein